MGVDALSMSPALLAEVKLAIRCFTRGRARKLADKALGMDDGFSIHRLMNGALEEIQGCPETEASRWSETSPALRSIPDDPHGDHR
jgi:signal transduction protein with GAF and PtsI domain